MSSVSTLHRTSRRSPLVRAGTAVGALLLLGGAGIGCSGGGGSAVPIKTVTSKHSSTHANKTTPSSNVTPQSTPAPVTNATPQSNPAPVANVTANNTPQSTPAPAAKVSPKSNPAPVTNTPNTPNTPNRAPVANTSPGGYTGPPVSAAPQVDDGSGNLVDPPTNDNAGYTSPTYDASGSASPTYDAGGYTSPSADTTPAPDTTAPFDQEAYNAYTQQSQDDWNSATRAYVAGDQQLSNDLTAQSQANGAAANDVWNGGSGSTDYGTSGGTSGTSGTSGGDAGGE